MLSFGKTGSVAVAAMSYLAQVHGKRAATAVEIAGVRGYSAAHVSKVLTQLSVAGLVEGRRGPRGGYRLAREPGSISLGEIIGQFEQHRNRILCPFGKGWCGNREPCPLHEEMVALQEHNQGTLRGMTLDAFTEEEG